MMKVLFFLALFGLFSFIQTSVVDLDPSNFDSVVDGSKNVFVEFFAPWCGHCKNLAPEYELVGEAFAREDSVVIAKVDADAHKELATRFEIHGFPTLKFFPKGDTKGKAYESGRTAEDIVTWINNQVGTKARIKKAPSAVIALDPSNFDRIALDKSKDVLVEFYAPWCGHCKRLAPDYEKIAQAFVGEENVVIAKVDADAHKELGSKYGVTGFPTIKWFGKESKDQPEDYNLARDVETFVDFVNKKAGTKRLADGSLTEDAGRIESLDKIAEKFIESSDKASLTEEAEQALKTLEGNDAKNGKYYVKVMEVIQKKGKDFVSSEIERLNRMLSGSLTQKKKDEFTVRKNILAAFQ